MNKAAFKRYSTYANAISMVIGAAMVSIPTMQLEAQTTGLIMMACNAVIGLCQFIKQEAKDVE